MHRSGQLGATISLVMLGLVLSAIIALPVRGVAFTVLGSQLAFQLSGLTQLAIAMTGLVAAGADAVIQAHPLNRRRSLAYSAAFWALPSGVALAGLTIVRELPWWGYRLAFILLCGGLLALVVVLQYHTISPDDPHKRQAHLGLNVIAYALALYFFVFLYGTRLRSVISATGVTLVGTALAVELLRDRREGATRSWVYAMVTGLALGELTWVLNYSALDARAGGALLLVSFYVITGIAQQYLWERLNRRVVAEYVALAALALLFIVGVFGWP